MGRRYTVRICASGRCRRYRERRSRRRCAGGAWAMDLPRRGTWVYMLRVREQLLTEP
nr:MAG TPA: hypothetical protein [Caudoviricetes sp.]